MDFKYSDRLYAAAENFLVNMFSKDPLMGIDTDDMGRSTPIKIQMDWEIDAAMHVVSGKQWRVEPQQVNMYVNGQVEYIDEDPESESGV